MSADFTSKRALVTGAGKGIGRATAIRLSRLGAKVFALSRTQSDLDSLKAENPEIEVLCVDLADWTKTREAVQKVTPIHLLVNNAAKLIVNMILDITPEEFDDSFNVNLKSLLNVTQVVVRDLIDRGEKGSIVNVSSMATFRSLPTLAAYSATKGALDTLTKSMAAEFSPKGIRANALNPTLIDTTMGRIVMKDEGMRQYLESKIPLGRLPEIEDAVEAIVFLLSDKSHMVNGHILPLEGGFLCV